MSDRAMLELAAKAIGIPVTPCCHIPSGGMWVFESPVDRFWNPLHEDGDAFRLAVNLSLFDSGHFMKFRLEETRANPARNDFVINRRAIVRAAAEIGKTK